MTINQLNITADMKLKYFF